METIAPVLMILIGAVAAIFGGVLGELLFRLFNRKQRRDLFSTHELSRILKNLAH